MYTPENQHGTQNRRFFGVIFQVPAVRLECFFKLRNSNKTRDLKHDILIGSGSRIRIFMAERKSLETTG